MRVSMRACGFVGLPLFNKTGVGCVLIVVRDDLSECRNQRFADEVPQISRSLYSFQ